VTQISWLNQFQFTYFLDSTKNLKKSVHQRCRRQRWWNISNIGDNAKSYK
jgi:hypothetical protein